MAVIMTIGKICIGMALLFVFCLLHNVSDSSEKMRARQMLMPIITFIITMAASLFGVLRLDVFTNMTRFAEFFHNADIVLMNVAVFACAIILKCVFRPILSMLTNKDEIIEATASSLYSYDEEYEQWFLDEKWVNMRSVMKFTVRTGIVVIGLFLGLTWAMGVNSEWWIPAVPCAFLAVLCDIQSLFLGMTKEEYERDIYGDEIGAWKVGSFFKVREVFNKMLSGPMLSSYIGSDFSHVRTTTDFVEKLKKSADENDRLMGAFFSVGNRQKRASLDNLHATRKMMHGKNVVFFNPFYQDLGLYILLPLIHALLSGKKCLIVVGRGTSAESVKAWLCTLVAEYTKMESLWAVDVLSEKAPACDIGILLPSALYSKDVLCANADFFRETGFVFLVEPSGILATGQIALSVIAEAAAQPGEKPVYCVCDLKRSGLVDTLSHVLGTEFTEVFAAPMPNAMYAGMAWDADGDYMRQQIFDKQTRFFGNGVELAAIAVKNQVPSVSWYGEKNVPLKDIRWIAGQQYATICRYMNQSVRQNSLYEKIKFIPELFAGKPQKECFIIAEDEFCHMFATMHAYLSRGTEQAFVNVLSGNYLLRDYMRCNQKMFMANPHAVPLCVSAYAKTQRNTLLRLIMKMVIQTVTPAEVVREFKMIGIEGDAVELMGQMLQKYTDVDETVLTLKTADNEAEERMGELIGIEISRQAFEKYFAPLLSCETFIVESDGEEEESRIAMGLRGHVAQKMLPGQYVVLDGKYYIVERFSEDVGCVLKRASDDYDQRRYYRQLRTYRFGMRQQVIRTHKVMDMTVSLEARDFTVHTRGYLDMTDSKNLRTAKEVSFETEAMQKAWERSYKNKNVLTITLPKTNKRQRFTIGMLLSEMFRTLFPDMWQYLAVLSAWPEENTEGMLNKLCYTMEGSFDADKIYIVEDSHMDLGLLEAVENHLQLIFELLSDYLSWHFEQMRISVSKDPVPTESEEVATKYKITVEKRKNVFSRAANRIMELFAVKDKPKKKKEEKKKSPTGSTKPMTQTPPTVSKKPTQTNPPQGTQTPPTVPLGTKNTNDDSTEKMLPVIMEGNKKDILDGSVTPQTDDTNTSTDNTNTSTDSTNTSTDDTNIPPESTEDDFSDDIEDIDMTVPPEEQIILHTEGEDLFSIDGVPDDLDLLLPVKYSRYQQECFLKFGFDEIDARLAIEDVLHYMRARGLCNNALMKARKRTPYPATPIDTKAVNHCDFCGMPLSGVSYEKLGDGRIRCNECSAEAVNTVEELKKLYYQTEKMLIGIFDIRFRVPIEVRTTDARTIARETKKVYKPSAKVAQRELGMAIFKADEFCILIENGCPRLSTVHVIARELTHIWQKNQWDKQEIRATYKDDNRDAAHAAVDAVYEGMALWVAIQLLYTMGETYYAQKQEEIARKRTDICGLGFMLYCDRYGMERSGDDPVVSPFASNPPLDPDEVLEKVKKSLS